jgi:S1-C subfamily serine protease
MSNGLSHTARWRCVNDKPARRILAAEKLLPPMDIPIMFRVLFRCLLPVLLLRVITPSLALAYSLEARDFERWVVLGAKDNLPDAADLSREYARKFAGVRVIRTENGWFAIRVGPIPVQTMSEARDWFGAQSSLPGDAYLARGSKLVEVVYRPDMSQVSAAQPPVLHAPEPDRVSSGSGFFITNKGHMLTNAHVVAECAKVSVRYGTDEARPARVQAKDLANDLALIATEITPEAVATIRGKVRLGDQVEAFGYPFSGLLSSGGIFTLGNVTALTGVRDDSRMLQISAPIQPGNSGGPLLDSSGRVVGVVVSKLNALRVLLVTEDVPQNVNFAIKATVVQNFVESQGLAFRSSEENARPMENPDIADLARSFSGRIECLH